MSICNVRRGLGMLGALAGMALLAGCGAIDRTADSVSGVGKTFVSGGGTKEQPVDPSLFAVQQRCPPIEVRADTFSLAVYAKGKEGVPEGLQYQASIRQYARECSHSGDQIRIKVGVAGRVVAGPAGITGPVVLPLRIAVTGPGESALASEMIPVEVGLDEASATVAWSRVVEDITVPAEGAGKIYVGFDADSGKRRRN